MATTIGLIDYKTKETPGYLNTLENDIKASKGADSDLLLNHPAIYIHVWQSELDKMEKTWSIYVGETNDIIGRTKQHWDAARISASKRKDRNWQHHMLEDVDEYGNQVIPTVYFFGHKLFHKSLTLDIENRLIDFCLAMKTARIYNGRGNAQGHYCGDDNFDDIFSMIWRYLKKDNPSLFLTEASIKKSAIYKASPNHQLTDDQKKAKQLIIDRTVDAIQNGKTNQLIFVEGEAGTGKTVLTSSAFYGILENELLQSLEVTCYMLVNHEEMRNVYKNIAKKLGYPEESVQVPTSFIREHSIFNPTTKKYSPDEKKVDLVFVDEAHLLWNQNNQAYDNGFDEPQLDEIMKRARVTVIMFDENQTLDKRQISTVNYMDAKRTLAKSQGPNPAAGKNNYIQLINQLRMNCSKTTMDWVDDITKKLVVHKLSLVSKHKDSKGYEVISFATPAELLDAIKKKANKKGETQLSRVIATYDWKYMENTAAPAAQKYWQIDIGGWTLPWNEQLYRVDIKPTLDDRKKRRYNALDWAEKDYSINEAGSFFTIQGFDLAYAGVILGPSVRYDKTAKRIWFDKSLRAWNNMKGKRVLQDGTVVDDVTETISKHELRVLMTRGTKGLYIYACDNDLRDVLNEALQK